MQELKSLYETAEKENIPVLPHPLPECGSVSVMEGKSCAIGMDSAVLDGGAAGAGAPGP